MSDERERALNPSPWVSDWDRDVLCLSFLVQHCLDSRGMISVTVIVSSWGGEGGAMCVWEAPPWALLFWTVCSSQGQGLDQGAAHTGAQKSAPEDEGGESGHKPW